MNDEQAEIRRQVRALLAWQGELGLCGLDVAPPTAEKVETPPPPAPASAAPGDARARALEAIGALGDGGSPTPTGRPARRKAPPSVLALPPALRAIREDIGECTRCKLHGGRTNLVFGVGSAEARLMFVGEAPGRDEDLLGEPFVGAAGQLLDRMIVAMGFSRADVYIANIIKCRPPKNRDPEPDEVAQCEPFLQRQIAAIGPEVIVALGRVAAQTLLRDSAPVTRLRGQWREYQGIPLMPTFHPAYLLRTPGDKRLAWDDLRAVMRRLGVPGPARG